MKSFAAVTALAVVLSTSAAFASEGNVSKSLLAETGLSSLNVISDAEGMDIRGQGYARSFGFALVVRRTTSRGEVGRKKTVQIGFGAHDALSRGPGSELAAGLSVAAIGKGFHLGPWAVGASIAYARN